jgi:ubiquinone/menaquinone biosynthesis C-methylase UbiE
LDRDNRNHRKKRQLIDAKTRAEEGDSVLEVGCGCGLHAAEWQHIYDLTAVDLSASLCQQASERATKATIQQANAKKLPFEENEFDAVVGNAVLHHLDRQSNALKEWCRVARKSVTLMEPNYLFPKELATAHLVPEEQHKRMMAPHRVKKSAAVAARQYDAEASVEPKIYTPPWPGSASGIYDLVDSCGSKVPVARWLSMLLLIHIDL